MRELTTEEVSSLLDIRIEDVLADLDWCLVELNGARVVWETPGGVTVKVFPPTRSFGSVKPARFDSSVTSNDVDSATIDNLIDGQRLLAPFIHDLNETART